MWACLLLQDLNVLVDLFREQLLFYHALQRTLFFPCWICVLYMQCLPRVFINYQEGTCVSACGCLISSLCDVFSCCWLIVWHLLRVVCSSMTVVSLKWPPPHPSHCTVHTASAPPPSSQSLYCVHSLTVLRWAISPWPSFHCGDVVSSAAYYSSVNVLLGSDRQACLL